MTQAAPEILPCPFCGNPAHWSEDSTLKPIRWRIKCERCLCSSGAYDGFQKAIAIEHWNRRPSPDAAPVEAYRERLDIAVEALRQIAEYSDHTGSERAFRQVQQIAESAYRLIEAEPFVSQRRHIGKDGWVTVPREPTDEQLLLMFRAFHTDRPEVLEEVMGMSDLSDIQTKHLRDGYTAALKAVPKARE